MAQRLQRGRANNRAQMQFGRIHEDHLNTEPSFGVSEESRGLPCLRWDNAVSKDMFPDRRGKIEGVATGGNDGLDSLNENYRVTISPLPKMGKSRGIVSVVSADTHIALNKVMGSRDGNRPPTESALQYNSRTDARGAGSGRGRVSHRHVDLQAKERTASTEAEIRDADIERWLVARRRFPEFRWAHLPLPLSTCRP